MSLPIIVREGQRHIKSNGVELVAKVPPGFDRLYWVVDRVPKDVQQMAQRAERDAMAIRCAWGCRTDFASGISAVSWGYGGVAASRSAIDALIARGLALASSKGEGPEG